jgi:hypothetical protein
MRAPFALAVGSATREESMMKITSTLAMTMALAVLAACSSNNAANNEMNASDMNLGTTDMNATDMNAAMDMNATGNVDMNATGNADANATTNNSY